MMSLTSILWPDPLAIHILDLHVVTCCSDVVWGHSDALVIDRILTPLIHAVREGLCASAFWPAVTADLPASPNLAPFPILDPALIIWEFLASLSLSFLELLESLESLNALSRGLRLGLPSALSLPLPLSQMLSLVLS